MFNRIKEWYNRQSSTMKGFIVLIILLIIGIILRFEYIIEHIVKGFNFFSK